MAASRRLQQRAQHFDLVSGATTPTQPDADVNEPLVDGGSTRRRAASSGRHGLHERKWQFNANGMYVAPHGIEVSQRVRTAGYPSALPLAGARAESLN